TLGTSVASLHRRARVWVMSAERTREANAYLEQFRAIWGGAPRSARELPPEATVRHPATPMRAPAFVLALCCLASLPAPAGAQQLPDLAPYLMTDRAAEVALARTAAPRAVSDSATVLVLTRTGFVEAAHGSNGFTCLVVRSFSGDVNDPDFVKN